MPLSTRDLSALPGPDRLEALTRSLAMLDAVMSPNWQYRYFSYDGAWSPEHQDRMAKMSNGSGDEYFITFSPEGVFIKGFAHESDFTPWARDVKSVWPGVLDSVPVAFDRFMREPAFDMDNTTFCVWRTPTDVAWETGRIVYSDMPDPDGSEDLLWMLVDNPATYQSFCLDYYEQKVELEPIRAIYAREPLTPLMARTLNLEAEWAEVLEEAAKLSYPTVD